MIGSNGQQPGEHGPAETYKVSWRMPPALVRVLADYLDRHPESLPRGRKEREAMSGLGFARRRLGPAQLARRPRFWGLRALPVDRGAGVGWRGKPSSPPTRFYTLSDTLLPRRRPPGGESAGCASLADDSGARIDRSGVGSPPSGRTSSASPVLIAGPATALLIRLSGVRCRTTSRASGTQLLCLANSTVVAVDIHEFYGDGSVQRDVACPVGC